MGQHKRSRVVPAGSWRHHRFPIVPIHLLTSIMFLRRFMSPRCDLAKSYCSMWIFGVLNIMFLNILIFIDALKCF